MGGGARSRLFVGISVPLGISHVVVGQRAVMEWVKVSATQSLSGGELTSGHGLVAISVEIGDSEKILDGSSD